MPPAGGDGTYTGSNVVYSYLSRRGDCPDEDIRDDMEEDERQLHSCNLMTIGAIARKAPAHCAHVLFSLLQDRSKKYVFTSCS